MLGNRKFQSALKRFEEALNDMKESVGEENFNFIASVTIFDKKLKHGNDGIWWSIGDRDSCAISAECLMDEIEIERKEDELFDINLN